MNGFAGGISPGTRPEPVVTLLRSMLAVKPGGRPASARELLTALPASHRQPVILVYLILLAFGRFWQPFGAASKRRSNSSSQFYSSSRTFFAIPGPFFFWKKLKTNLFSSGRGKPANQNPISSNMNDDGSTDLIAPTHEMGASVRAFKTKEYDLRPNRTIQSRIHLLVQEMPYLIHETCLCMAVAVLLLVGGAAVLAVQIETKIVEGFELMFGER